MFSLPKKQLCGIFHHMKVKQLFSNKSPFQKDKKSDSPFESKPKTWSWLSSTIKPSQKATDDQQKTENTQQTAKDEKIASLKEQEINPLTSQKNQNIHSAISHGIGLNRFLGRIYTTTGISLALTLSAASIGIFYPVVVEQPLYLIIGGGAVSSIFLLIAKYISPQTIREKIFEETVIRTKNPLSRLIALLLGSLAMGLSASPLFAIIHASFPSVIPCALGITAAIFGATSLLSYSVPKGYFLGFGSVLTAGLAGLLGINLIGIGVSYFFGFNYLADLLFQAQNYIGICTFSMLIAYQTQLAIKKYQEGQADHVSMSIQLFLDIWNLLIRIIAELAKAQARSRGKK